VRERERERERESVESLKESVGVGLILSFPNLLLCKNDS